jgi:hypothetical protein
MRQRFSSRPEPNDDIAGQSKTTDAASLTVGHSDNAAEWSRVKKTIWHFALMWILSNYL